MSVVLTATCGCGRSVSVTCPTLEPADMAAAHAMLEAAGMRWDERLGHVCREHPTCLPGETPP